MSLHSGLVLASNRAQRLSVLKVALIAFDHRVTCNHDFLMRAGAGSVLMGCLARATNGDENWTETSQICQVLNMSFRCSDPCASSCFTLIGAELLPMLISLLFAESNHKELVAIVHLVIRRLAMLDIPFRKITKYERLIGFLHQFVTMDGTRHRDAVLGALCAITGLTRNGSNKFLAIRPGFLDDIFDKALNEHDPDIKFELTKLVRNFTREITNKATIAKHNKCVKALIGLCSTSDLSDKSCKVPSVVETIATLRQLSVEAQCRAPLVFSEYGALLDVLMAATNSPELQESAVETLKNLACLETARHMGKHPGLLARLSSIACNLETRYVAEAAAQTIKRLASYIPVKDRSHELLLDALCRASQSTDHRVRRWVAKAFVEQSKLAGSSFYIVRNPQVTCILSELAKDLNSKVRAITLECIEKLTSDTSNAKRLAGDANVLDAITENASEPGNCEAAVDARRFAVQALLCLASHHSANSKLAKHLGTVESLSKYGVSTDNDVELKRAALHGVILLAPLM